MNQTGDRAYTTATAIAHRLATPIVGTDSDPCWPQSLAKGAPGIALLHIERAHLGLANWNTVHAWLKTAATTDISAADDAGLFFGVPAVAFAVQAAAGTDRYIRTLAALDTHVAALAHRRVDQAHARIERGDLPALAEFDLIYGLTGIGAYLLRRDPHGGALGRILGYLVRLTEPLHIDGQTLPGWWTSHGPSFTSSPDFAGGHGNFGMAHGIAGPLALLAVALRRGAIVDGHAEAIERICAWLDTWRQDHGNGPWWPQWITRDELQVRRPRQPGPLRPSWCYGTPGLARAQQLAGLATGDTARQHTAERAFGACLADSGQLGRIADTSLCHGWAGLFQTAWRAASDARTPAITDHLSHITRTLTEHKPPSIGQEAGLLEGDAGFALALHSATHVTPPISDWDACLLVG